VLLTQDTTEREDSVVEFALILGGRDGFFLEQFGMALAEVADQRLDLTDRPLALRRPEVREPERIGPRIVFCHAVRE
jgi:hypothetical protein